jgi:hypothetical protein
MQSNEYYEEQPQQQQGLPYVSPMQSYGNSIIQMTNPEDSVINIEMGLRGQMVNSEGQVKQITSPLLNDDGICAVMSLVRSVVSSVTIMSNLSVKKEISPLMEYLADTLARDILANRKKYGLSPYDRDKVFHIVWMNSFICMKRAAFEEISDKRFWRHSVQQIDQNVQSSPQKSGGLLSKFFGK